MVADMDSLASRLIIGSMDSGFVGSMGSYCRVGSPPPNTVEETFVAKV